MRRLAAGYGLTEAFRNCGAKLTTSSPPGAAKRGFRLLGGCVAGAGCVDLRAAGEWIAVRFLQTALCAIYRAGRVAHLRRRPARAENVVRIAHQTGDHFQLGRSTPPTFGGTRSLALLRMRDDLLRRRPRQTGRRNVRLSQRAARFAARIHSPFGRQPPRGRGRRAPRRVSGRAGGSRRRRRWYQFAGYDRAADRRPIG